MVIIMNREYRVRLESFFIALKVARNWYENGLIELDEFKVMIKKLSKKYGIKSNSLYCLISIEPSGNITH